MHRLGGLFGERQQVSHMKQHVPQADPWVLASMQIFDIISHLLMGPDRGRITQSAPESQTDLQAGTRSPRRVSVSLPSHPACTSLAPGLPTSSRQARLYLKKSKTATKKKKKKSQADL